MDSSRTTADPRTRHALKALARPWLRRLRYTPTERWLWARRLWYAPGDALDRLSGRYDPAIPPRWLRIVGSGEFTAVGEAFLTHFVDFGGLRPDEAVLDIGCAVGRMALPLARYLGDQGRYEGFDIVPEAVRWCQRCITPRHPNFHFQVADVRNARYHPTGRETAVDYTFPYPDATFGFAFATSVFTHMPTDAVAHYLAETARVLASGGRLLATFFLINAESQALIARGASDLRFVRSGAHHHTLAERPGDPDYLVAFDEDVLRGLLADAGLSLDAPIRYGSWCGRATHVSYQDLVVARKT
jgi:SAM-dependent methyltransferase